MRLYRITKQKYLENLSGLGVSYELGARWNLPGTPVIYFALSPSVAMLEMSHYTASPRMIPPSYRLGVYEIPNDAPIEKLDDENLPPDWQVFPYPFSTQSLGDQWLKSLQSLGLIVPSCTVSNGLESIIVINPTHEMAKQIHLIESYADIYNVRAFQAL